jgi:hypothetical protein
VERQLRNALSLVREAEGLAPAASSVHADAAKIAEDLADAVALAAASRRRLVEAGRTARQAA